MPAIAIHHRARYVQGTIEAILSSGMTSRLFQEIREKRGLVYSVYGYFRPYEDVGQGCSMPAPIWSGSRKRSKR